MKVVIVIVFTAIALFPVGEALAQTAALSLAIPPTARANAMGEAYVAIADESSAAWWNPAGLGFLAEKDARNSNGDTSESDRHGSASSERPRRTSTADVSHDESAEGLYVLGRLLRRVVCKKNAGTRSRLRESTLAARPL